MIICDRVKDQTDVFGRAEEGAQFTTALFRLHSSKSHFVYVLSIINSMLLKLVTTTVALKKILSLLKSWVKLSLNRKVSQAVNGVSGLFPRKHKPGK